MRHDCLAPLQAPQGLQPLPEHPPCIARGHAGLPRQPPCLMPGHAGLPGQPPCLAPGHAGLPEQPPYLAPGYAELMLRLHEERALRHAAEQALVAAQADLARMARICTMGKFAASIAHEVQQPLAAIMLNAGAGLNWLRQSPPRVDQATAALEQVLNAGAGAGEVMRSIHAMASHGGPSLVPLLAEEAIGDVLTLLRAECHKHTVSVTTDLAPQRCRVHADRAQLRQVVMNLVLNAIDALRSVQDRPRVIAVRSRDMAGGAGLRISVEDNGIGIDAALDGRLFEPLASSKPDGMGLGLSICRSIVEAHGGRIWHAPRRPHGTVFHFTIQT